MDKHRREQLKSDRFAEEVGHSLEYVTGHRQQLGLYSAIGAGVVVLILAIYFYTTSQGATRQEQLRAALHLQDGVVGTPNPSQVSFNTQAEKDAAVIKAFTALVDKYPGTREGAIGRYYLGVVASDQGRTADAEKAWKAVADSGDVSYGSQAKLSLAQVYASQGKLADAESLLKSVIDHPTVLVSKEQAIITLAKIKAPTDPAGARKMLEPLRAERNAVSRAAITALSELPQQR